MPCGKLTVYSLQWTVNFEPQTTTLNHNHKRLTVDFKMKFQFNIFIAALGLALIIEGMPYFLGPEAVKRMVIKLTGLPAGVLRGLGLASIGVGLLLIALSRYLG